MKQRFGLSKALEEPRLQRGQERVMASTFWMASRNRAAGRLLALGAPGRAAVRVEKRTTPVG